MRQYFEAQRLPEIGNAHSGIVDRAPAAATTLTSHFSIQERMVNMLRFTMARALLPDTPSSRVPPLPACRPPSLRVPRAQQQQSLKAYALQQVAFNKIPPAPAQSPPTTNLIRQRSALELVWV